MFLFFIVGCGGSGVVTESKTQPGAPNGISTGKAGDAASPVIYTFAVCGDNRTMGIENGILPRIIESAKARGADFMINTGDVSGEGSRGELSLYRDLTDASGLRIHTVPGNHDVGRGGTSEAYESIIGATYYSFDQGGDHFIVLDNADDRIGIDQIQMQWLTADLARNSDKPRQFIFAHIPVADPSLPSGHVSGELGDEGLRSGQQLVAEASTYANVSDFFFGHIHAYFSYKLDGIDAYVTGGAGAPLYFPESSGGYYHYLLVSVHPESVELEVVRV
ncbi:MAG: metallophosphoesterase family protein [Thermoleophilia bacterium]